MLSKINFWCKKRKKEHIQFYLFTVRKAFYFKVITITNDFILKSSLLLMILSYNKTKISLVVKPTNNFSDKIPICPTVLINFSDKIPICPTMIIKLNDK